MDDILKQMNLSTVTTEEVKHKTQKVDFEDLTCES